MMNTNGDALRGLRGLDIKICRRVWRSYITTRKRGKRR